MKTKIMEMRFPIGIRRVSLLLREAGASMTLLVGGAVIDSLKGREVKDWDIEVYGLSMEEIEDCLKGNKLEANMVGKEFGIIKTNIDDLDVDINVPRRENKIGKGHTAFAVELDPSMTPKEAGRRRDLTINSMYIDIETGLLVDPFNGLKDLEEGIIRMTDPETFREDPLRVLRVMQLLPRKGKVVDPATLEACRSLVGEFDTLASERVFEEFVKLLLMAEKPSVGLEFLKDSGWLCHFPELEALVGCPQHPEWHPEGDVWEHTKLVLDMAVKLRGSLPEEWQLAYMFGALLHDVGKPATTGEDLTAHGHDAAGEGPAMSFMVRITNNKDLIKKTLAIVVNHMRCGQITREEAKASAWKRLHNRLRLDVAAAMSKADSLSRWGDVTLQHRPSEIAMAYFEEFGEEKIPQILTGKFLIERGHKPGREFGNILRAGYEFQIEHGEKDAEVIYAAIVQA